MDDKKVCVLIVLFQDVIDNVEVYANIHNGENEYKEIRNQILENEFPDEYKSSMNEDEKEELFACAKENMCDDDVYYFVVPLIQK
jgi:hypothetical protein